jgi:hypothetical protein
MNAKQIAVVAMMIMLSGGLASCKRSAKVAADAKQTPHAYEKAAPAPAEAPPAPGNVRLAIVLPKPQFGGTPPDLRSPNLEPDRGGKPRPTLHVPAGADQVLSKDCKVTSSDPEPIIGELAFASDGDKEHGAESYMELGPGTQWVQLDLGRERDVRAVCVWHYHGEPRVYRDVVCQLSNDPDFVDGVATVFNNDHDNSSGLGAGKDFEYIETFEGRPFAVSGVKARYVRLYSNGNTSNEMNHYTEVEVYGRK